MSDDLRIQAAIRADATSSRDVEQVGPFVATYDSSSRNPFLNYAIPNAGAEPTDEDVEALVAAYRSRGRKPRLEYLPSLAPAIESRLLDAGFEVELRTPLMIFDGGRDRVDPPEGLELVEARTRGEILAVGIAQNEAYEEPGAPTDSWVDGVLESIDSGSVRLLARDVQSGDPAGAGGYARPHEGACELYGIGVRKQYRRRGIAVALASWLARTAHDRGVVTLFLMAHGESEARIYERAGFRQIGEVVHISRPA